MILSCQELLTAYGSSTYYQDLVIMFCDDFKRLFPNYLGTKYIQNNAEVTETQKNAKVRKVIWMNSGCQICDTKMIKDFTNFFQLAGADEMFHKDCDGILLFDGSEGRKYIVLCELKSKFDPLHIYEAYKQIISSYIKLSTLMNLLPNYQKTDFEVKGFIFSKPKNCNIERDLYKWYLAGKDNSKTRKEAKFALDLCFRESPYNLKFNSCELIEHLRIGENIQFNSIDFYHIDVDDESGIYHIDTNDYLK